MVGTSFLQPTFQSRTTPFPSSRKLFKADHRKHIRQEVRVELMLQLAGIWDLFEVIADVHHLPASYFPIHVGADKRNHYEITFEVEVTFYSTRTTYGPDAKSAHHHMARRRRETFEHSYPIS